MNMQKIRRILHSMSEIVSRGEHFQWSGLSHISAVSGLNRQTVWRYLQKLERSGHVYKVEKTWRGETCYRYYMTADGKKLLMSFKELTGLESVTK